MTTLTVFAYLCATLFLIFLTRAVWIVIPEYRNLIRVWWLEKRGYKYFYFNKGNTKVLARDEKQAYAKYKSYKKSNHKKRMYKI